MLKSQIQKRSGRKDKPVILVVDDQLQNIELLEAYLVPQGYEIIKATNGKEALGKLSGNQIDLILLDVMMPSLNGYEVCSRLKADPSSCKIPVIFISALDDVKDKVKGLSAGGVDYISKPFESQEVLARVRTHLELRNLQIQLERSNEMLKNEIKERKLRQSIIEHLSYHDQLTEIYNRRFFVEELRRLDTERQLPISIIMADIDRLKYVNDKFGHNLGDRLIINASKIIKDSCREEDIVARWGGDEFIALLPKTSEEDVSEVINRIRKACNSNKTVGKIKISISLGFSTKNEPGTSIEEIIKQADKNMYDDKARLKNDTEFKL